MCDSIISNPLIVCRMVPDVQYHSQLHGKLTLLQKVMHFKSTTQAAIDVGRSLP